MWEITKWVRKLIKFKDSKISFQTSYSCRYKTKASYLNKINRLLVSKKNCLINTKIYKSKFNKAKSHRLIKILSSLQTSSKVWVNRCKKTSLNSKMSWETVWGGSNKKLRIRSNSKYLVWNFYKKTRKIWKPILDKWAKMSKTNINN